MVSPRLPPEEFLETVEAAFGGGVVEVFGPGGESARSAFRHGFGSSGFRRRDEVPHQRVAAVTQLGWQARRPGTTAGDGGYGLRFRAGEVPHPQHQASRSVSPVAVSAWSSASTRERLRGCPLPQQTQWTDRGPPQPGPRDDSDDDRPGCRPEGARRLPETLFTLPCAPPALCPFDGKSSILVRSVVCCWGQCERASEAVCRGSNDGGDRRSCECGDGDADPALVCGMVGGRCRVGGRGVRRAGLVDPDGTVARYVRGVCLGCRRNRRGTERRGCVDQGRVAAIPDRKRGSTGQRWPRDQRVRARSHRIG